MQGKLAVLDILKVNSPVVEPCRNPRYIAVANGVWDDEEKRLLPFTPELVFTCKLGVGFNPNANDVQILEPDGSVWCVEDWFRSINSNPDNVHFLWDVLGMVVRPNRLWSKAIFLYSDRGNNGKGTYCELMRNILGKGQYASIDIESFKRPFSLTKLVEVQAVIADENAVGGFIDDVSNFKAAITGDAIQIDRKYKDPITIRFYGMVVQCINGFPKVKDQSPSFLRRIVMVKMDQNFEGKEKKYIKQDYITRKEVLEYILKKLLLMDISEDTVEVPVSSAQLLQEYREYNDPVFEFWNEFKDEFVWNLLPYVFLYDLFNQWFKKLHPSGKPMSYKQFVQNLRSAADTSGGWDTSNMQVRSLGRMDAPEYLIIDWDLEDWMNGTYSGNDWKLKVSGKRKVSYRGLQRL